MEPETLQVIRLPLCVLACLRAVTDQFLITADIRCQSLTCVACMLLQCLHKAMAQVKPEARFRDLGDTISRYAQQQGYASFQLSCLSK